MRWRQDPVTHELVPADEAAYNAMHHIMPEIQPYQSMKTGEWITSRAQHQEHLRRHDCFEIGNEIAPPKPVPVDPHGEIKESYKRSIMGMGYDRFKKALKSEIDFVTWNSRGLPRS